MDSLVKIQPRSAPPFVQATPPIPRPFLRPGRIRSSTVPCRFAVLTWDVVGGRVRQSSVVCPHAAPGETPFVAAATTGAGTVRIIVTGRKLEVTDAIRNYAEKKVSQALDHYAPSIKTAEVTLSVRGGDTGTKGAKEQKTEITVRTLRTGVIRSEVTADNLYASIDLVCHKLERRMQKVKELAMSKGKWPGTGGRKGGERLADVEVPVTESLDVQEEFVWRPEIVRTKYFALDSMTAVEAAETLENLGHDFYVFRDEETNQVNVVYKRKERGYGVIIPTETA